MLFVCYPKCTTCKKAKTYLDEKGVKYDWRDIKESNPTYDELKKWLGKSGLPIKRFFNTSGQVYRTLNLKDKIESMTEDECLHLLSTDGMLVKRPILVSDNFVLAGFKEKEWEAAFASDKEV